jgi:hypothetical protein
MNTFENAHELKKARARVLRLYGSQKINKDQHDAGLALLEVLDVVLTDPGKAKTVNATLGRMQEEVVHAGALT